MYGDFSRWSFDPRTNFSGILHQQGRVLLDADTNDQTLLGLRWQDTAARDAFGALVLAVPASERQSFEVTAVKPDGADLEVTLRPGRAWADGDWADGLCSRTRASAADCWPKPRATTRESTAGSAG